MKKVLSLIMALALCLSLCACGGGEVKDTTPENTTPEVTVPETTVPKETEHVMTAEETFAAKLLIAAAKGFIHPLSIKLNNVWINSISSGKMYQFTFEFDVKNSAGNIETVFYGTAISISDLSDETLEKVISDIKSYNLLGGSSLYFRENEIDAMQKGTALDAECIQQYFLMNYK